ncbi:helix-turn-helix domain-containing protein (plasmid) [Bradyrhizobium barranii subsp. barranii]|uniref:Helix-turn-helix domain-containing protein n=1 Tax=Bradyrhizobium barranii subsp. barranii TaxID=2823807 RepID=A0A939MGI5_9BRAD|nr:helix-turn-helix transcriptional regulator [Bradyrhizobium barranii]UEM18074.1 helix-turn-helix domain-containing protein [Bradyrhizobium barranii subsp. barranii]
MLGSSAKKDELGEYLAANVRRLRKDRKLSQAELASALGVDPAAISLIELKRSNPTVSMLDAIATALKTTSAELLTRYRRAQTKAH